jgi:hypothetical protein
MRSRSGPDAAVAAQLTQMRRRGPDPVVATEATTVNKKTGDRSADEERWGMSRAELEKRILPLHKGDSGILKIGKALRIAT